jgi:hypothetical protein
MADVMETIDAEMERVTLEIHDAAQAALAKRRATTPADGLADAIEQHIRDGASDELIKLIRDNLFLVTKSLRTYARRRSGA